MNILEIDISMLTPDQITQSQRIVFKGFPGDSDPYKDLGTPAVAC